MAHEETDSFGGGLKDGIFDWQRVANGLLETGYDRTRWWGNFPADVDENAPLPAWAIGPVAKCPGNPVLAPSPDGWDSGRYGGGVHNGSVLVRNGKFHYVYRGEFPLSEPIDGFNYMCDIGMATSDDGIHFVKDAHSSPFFRRHGDERYSFEDVSLVEHQGTFYLFCNRWDWRDPSSPAASGAFLATSTDLRRWYKHGLLFPHATEIHRNPVILQSPGNHAATANGRFVMYLNFGLIAYSDDLVHWTSHKIKSPWPGGENCAALVDWNPDHPENILVFTGGPHSGHFYAMGEVLLDRANPERALEWLPRPILTADPAIPHEDGRSATAPHHRVSNYRDCIFFNAVTRHEGKWWFYYGGSEYYTCLATAPASQ